MSPPELPFELVAIIVSLAAREDQQTGVALTLVSSEIQAIADAFLFQDVYFRKHQDTTNMLKAMASTSCSSRLVRARAHVASIRQYPYGKFDRDVLEGVLRNCPNLQILAARALPRPALTIPLPSGLKTLAVTVDSVLHDMWPPLEPQEHPFFRSITHLIVERTKGSFHLQKSSLTHLFMGCMSQATPPWILPPPPHLQLALVYFMPEDFDNIVLKPSFMAIQYQGKVDKRFVLVVPPSYETWARTNTSSGFLVAPDWDSSYYPMEWDRTMLYDWLKEEAWNEGEKIVRRRGDGV
ncbi:hypothetical protein DL96DRAFT_1620854 [Flagelloscypha sp. PMI_526]|nr:hypothetical protein DL96DRAFT_1620854 [Flagelloscypha sp. PMI_526]